MWKFRDILPGHGRKGNKAVEPAPVSDLPAPKAPASVSSIPKLHVSPIGGVDSPEQIFIYDDVEVVNAAWRKGYPLDVRHLRAAVYNHERPLAVFLCHVAGIRPETKEVSSMAAAALEHDDTAMLKMLLAPYNKENPLGEDGKSLIVIAAQKSTMAEESNGASKFKVDRALENLGAVLAAQPDCSYFFEATGKSSIPLESQAWRTQKMISEHCGYAMAPRVVPIWRTFNFARGEAFRRPPPDKRLKFPDLGKK